MMTMNMQWMALGLTVAALGCGKKTDDGGAAPSGDKASELPAEISAWMPPTAATAWQGTWVAVLGLSADGMQTNDHAFALEIKGATAKASDGKADYDLGFSLTPCAATFAQPMTSGSMKGGTSYVTLRYAIVGGKVVAGSGAAGMRKGKAAVACTLGADGGTYTLDDKGACAKWENSFGHWSSKPGKCVWSTEGGKDRLTIGDGEWATKLDANGDVLTNEQFDTDAKRGVLTPAPDFATAKKTATAQAKADDPGEQAKAAGGKVGDLASVRGLIASYAADPTLKGKPATVTALYQNTGSSSDGKTTTYNAVLIDSTETSKFSLECDTKEEVKDLVQGTKVVATGTIDEGFGPRLKDCTLTKAP